MNWKEYGRKLSLSNLSYYRGIYEFCHRLYIPHELPDDGLTGPKYVVSGVIKTFVCVTLPIRYYFIFPRRLRKIICNLSQDSRCRGSDSNQAPIEYNSEALSLEPIAW
jgi:hypothetical protein